jgi:hypothetical protein
LLFVALCRLAAVDDEVELPVGVLEHSHYMKNTD